MRISRKSAALLCLVGISALALYSDDLLASSMNFGASLPWEGPLDSLKKSLSGPVAQALSLAGIVMSGAGLVFGGDLSGITRTLMQCVLAVSLCVGANRILDLVGGSGTTIPAVEAVRVQP